jgi:hypothetical protein
MDFGMDGFGGFDALDAIAGAAQAILPVAVGTGVCFGVTEAVTFLVSNATVLKWRWAIGFAGSLLLGLAMWKFRSAEDGALTIGSGLLTAAVGYGNEKLLIYKATKAGATPVGFYGRRGLGEYVVSKPEPLLAGGFGRYMVEPAQPLYAGQMEADEIVSLGGYINPGVFG